MNKARRGKIKKVIAVLEEQKAYIEEILEEEQEALENLPENLQGSQNHDELYHDCDWLRDTYESLETAIDSLTECIDH